MWVCTCCPGLCESLGVSVLVWRVTLIQRADEHVEFAQYNRVISGNLWTDPLRTFPNSQKWWIGVLLVRSLVHCNSASSQDATLAQPPQSVSFVSHIDHKLTKDQAQMNFFFRSTILIIFSRESCSELTWTFRSMNFDESHDRRRQYQTRFGIQKKNNIKTFNFLQCRLSYLWSTNSTFRNSLGSEKIS